MCIRDRYQDLNVGFEVPDAVVVEDSKSGYQFYDALCNRLGIPCYTATGVANLKRTIHECPEQNVLAIGDGAAFGPYIEKVLDVYKRHALANGETHVTCNTTCADIEATVRCLTALGARIETVEDGFQVHPTMKSVEFGLLKALDVYKRQVLGLCALPRRPVPGRPARARATRGGRCT